MRTLRRLSSHLDKPMNESPLPVTKSTLFQLCEVVCFHYDGAIIFKVDELAVKRCVSVDEAAWRYDILDRQDPSELRGTDFTCPLKHTKWINDNSVGSEGLLCWIWMVEERPSTRKTNKAIWLNSMMKTHSKNVFPEYSSWESHKNREPLGL